MPIPKKIIKFLDSAKVKYELIEHKTVYTAHDKAATLKVPEKIIGKTLILKIDNKLCFVLIPANKNLDKNKFKKISKAKKADFATERLIKNKIKGAKVGAIPPFDLLFQKRGWKIPTFIEKSLMNQSKIIVNGGNYGVSIGIKASDFKKLISDLVIGIFSKSKC